MAAPLPRAVGRSADRGRREAHLLRHQFPSIRQSGRRSRRSPTRSSAPGESLATRSVRGGPYGRRADDRRSPAAVFARHAQARRSISVRYNYQNAVWQTALCAPTLDGKNGPSFASAALADVAGDPEARPSRSIIPSILEHPVVFRGGRARRQVRSPSELAGKDVVIGIGTDVHRRPVLHSRLRHGLVGVYVHAIGAETLKNGAPGRSRLDLPLPAGALRGGACRCCARRGLHQVADPRAARLAGPARGPAFLEANLIFADVTPALFVLLIVAAALGWRRYRAARPRQPDLQPAEPQRASRANRDGREAGADRGARPELRGNRRHACRRTASDS